MRRGRRAAGLEEQGLEEEGLEEEAAAAARPEAGRRAAHAHAVLGLDQRATRSSRRLAAGRRGLRAHRFGGGLHADIMHTSAELCLYREWCTLQSAPPAHTCGIYRVRYIIIIIVISLSKGEPRPARARTQTHHTHTHTHFVVDDCCSHTAMRTMSVSLH